MTRLHGQTQKSARRLFTGPAFSPQRFFFYSLRGMIGDTLHCIVISPAAPCSAANGRHELVTAKKLLAQ